MEKTTVTVENGIVFGLKDLIGKSFKLQGITKGEPWTPDDQVIEKFDLILSGAIHGIPQGLLSLAKYGRSESNGKALPRNGKDFTIPHGDDVNVKVIAYGNGATLLFTNAEASWFQ